jgi:hypothetical protein
VETQTDITRLNKADKPTRLTAKTTGKIITPSKKVANSSQTTSSSRTTPTSDSKLSTTSNSTSHQNKKEQRKSGLKHVAKTKQARKGPCPGPQ